MENIDDHTISIYYSDNRKAMCPNVETNLQHIYTMGF